MNREQQNTEIAVPMYDLLDACCALQGGLELDKHDDKNYALKHALNVMFGYMTPEAKAEFQDWVGRKGWRQKEKIILM